MIFAIERLAERHAKHGNDPKAEYGIKAVVPKMDMVEQPDGGLLVTAIANTDDVDLVDEVVLPDGAEMTDTPNGPQPTYLSTYRSVYINHEYNTMPVGTHRVAQLRGNKWLVRYLLHGQTQESADLVRLAKLGDDNPVRGISIGFIRQDWGKPTPQEIAKYGPVDVVTRRWRWLEYSVTPQPCNPGCNITAMEAAKGVRLDDATAKAIDAFRARGVIARKTAEALGVKVKRIVTVPKIVRL